jgi:2-dehydro-3-deoxygluconokinase
MTRPGLVTVGESMALITAKDVGSFNSQRDLRLSMAGAESNVAIGVCRLGSTAHWVSRLGDDSFGELIRRELRAEKVDVAADTDSTRPTGLMVKERVNALTTRVRYYRASSAASAISMADLESHSVGDLIRRAAVLHVTGITAALGPGPADALRLAVEIARQSGTTVSLDLNYRAALWSREEAGQVLAPIAAQADVIFAGPEEASLIVPDGAPEKLARSLSELGPAQVVVKLGADGALSLIDGVERRTAAVEVPVVDPVGAGDAFVAGYLAELMSGEPAEQRLAVAAAAGAFACTTLGDWEGLPTRVDLAALGRSDNVDR